MLAWMGGTNAQHARLREQLCIDTETRLFAAARPTALETVTKFVVCPSSRRPVTFIARREYVCWVRTQWHSWEFFPRSKI